MRGCSRATVYGCALSCKSSTDIQELLERCRFKNHRLHVNWQSCIYGPVTDVEIQPLTEESVVQGASVIFKTP